MTRIGFYHNAPDKLKVAATLARKAHAAGNQLLIFSRDRAQIEALDRLLWSEPATGFLPHCRSTDAHASETPVILSQDDSHMPHHHDVLMNLDAGRPAHFSRFERLIEIVSRDDEDRVNARERFKFYRDRGYEITSVDLANRPGS